MTWHQIGGAAQTVVDRLRNCPHHSLRVVWSKYSSYGDEFQRRQLRNYCDDCGRLLGGELKHSLARADTPELTIEDAQKYQRTFDEHQARLEAEREAEWEEMRDQRRADYLTYLQSPEWQAKRELVLKRAAGVCEGCGQAEAAEVHHLTYEHLFGELLWELVAICRACHERVHGIWSGNR